MMRSRAFVFALLLSLAGAPPSRAAAVRSIRLPASPLVRLGPAPIAPRLPMAAVAPAQGVLAPTAVRPAKPVEVSVSGALEAA